LTKNHNPFPDVLIVGAGPAGSASAIELRRFGFSVSLVDKANFPRPQIGESLPPSIFPLLQHLGLMDVIEKAKFETTKQVNISWAGHQFERILPSGLEALNVDRGIFDYLMLDSAAATGVEVSMGVRLSKPKRRLNRDRWDLIVEDGTTRCQISPRYIVDATGRRGWISRGKVSIGSPQLALYSYWKLPSDHRWQGSYIETSEDDWSWCCKLTEGRAVAAVFLDPALLKSKEKKAICNEYLGRIAKKEFSGLISKGVQGIEIKACNASVIVSSNPITDGLICVGDACFAQDPLSSQGVQSAIAMALQASVVINTILKYPGHRNISEQFYKDRLKQKKESHLTQIREHYQKASQYYQTPFWARRADIPVKHYVNIQHTAHKLTANNILALAHNVSIVGSPVIRNGVIQNELAISRPGLDEPIVEVNLLPVSALLKILESCNQVGRLVSALQSFGSPAQVLKGLEVLVNLGLLNAYEANI